MCGRYSIFTPTDVLKLRFNVSRAEALKPTYNAAPTQNLPVILNSDPRTIQRCRWGLIPSWAKEERIGNRMINARAETLLQKPSFRTPFKKQRCLVLTDGFYEWKQTSDGKVPHRISMRDHEPFAFAGIWEVWKTPDGEDIQTFSIITTEPNELMKPLHHRMPVIVKQENEEKWLQEIDVSEAQKMLEPYPFEDLEAYPISTLVNSPRNNSEDIIKPLR
ncbi:MAG: SOS response-associated peptidase [Acidobacteria bacterium]|nr:SOS response-associated peptidase [Acidobacteriota bacterium]